MRHKRFGFVRNENFLWTFTLIRILIKKDLATRYQRSILGVWWSLINPTITALTLFFVFHASYAGKFNGKVAYGPYILSGTLIVGFLGLGIVTVTQGLQASASIFTRLPAPANLFAVSNSIVLSINVLFGLVPLILWNLFSGGSVTLWLILVPIELLIGAVFVVGCSLLAFNAVVRFGDTINLMVLISTLLMYLTPVFYPLDSVSRKAHFLLNLNPLTHFVNIFRSLTIGFGTSSVWDWGIISIFALVSYAFGLNRFKRHWGRSVSLL